MADPGVSAALEAPPGCPGHGSAATERKQGSASATDSLACSGCALMAASVNGAGKQPSYEGGADQIWLVAASACPAPRPQLVTGAGFREQAPAFSPGLPDTPVTRFDRLFLPG